MGASQRTEPLTRTIPSFEQRYAAVIFRKENSLAAHVCRYEIYEGLKLTVAMSDTPRIPGPQLHDMVDERKMFF